jgi:hypothetical protein
VRAGRHGLADREQEGGGVLGGGAGGLGQDTGVGVGGQDDGGVAELVLHHLQVDPGGQREGRGAVPQPVQRDRRQAGGGGPWVSPADCDGALVRGGFLIGGLRRSGPMMAVRAVQDAAEQPEQVLAVGQLDAEACRLLAGVAPLGA